VYGTGEMQNYLISFANTLNPNYNSGFLWPQWTPKARRLLIFRGGLLAPIAWGKDTYREVSVCGRRLLLMILIVGFIGINELFDGPHVEISHMMGSSIFCNEY
jgi:hypothetical protein